MGCSPLSPFSLAGDGNSSGTPFRSDFPLCLSAPCDDIDTVEEDDDEVSLGRGSGAPFTQVPPSDFPKLNNLPGLNVLLGDCDRSWPAEPALLVLVAEEAVVVVVVEELPPEEAVDVVAAAAAAAAIAAASFLFSGDLRNLKLRNPGSLGSLPVGDCGERAVPDENLL